MAKTTVTLKSVDIQPRRFEIRVTAAGYRLHCYANEVHTINETPTDSFAVEWEAEVSPELSAEIDKVVAAERKAKYA